MGTKIAIKSILNRFPPLQNKCHICNIYLFQNREKEIYTDCIKDFTLTTNEACVFCQITSLFLKYWHDMVEWWNSIGWWCKTILHWQCTTFNFFIISVVVILYLLQQVQRLGQWNFSRVEWRSLQMKYWSALILRMWFDSRLSWRIYTHDHGHWFFFDPFGEIIVASKKKL